MGILDPDFPEITEAQRIWQGNYLPMVAAQVAGIEPEFADDDYVQTIDRITGIPFLPGVSEFGGGGGGGGALTPILVDGTWDKIVPPSDVFLDSSFKNLYVVNGIAATITFHMLPDIFIVGDMFKLTCFGGGTEFDFVGDGATVIGPTNIVDGVTAYITCIVDGFFLITSSVSPA